MTDCICRHNFYSSEYQIALSRQLDLLPIVFESENVRQQFVDFCKIFFSVFLEEFATRTTSCRLLKRLESEITLISRSPAQPTIINNSLFPELSIQISRRKKALVNKLRSTKLSNVQSDVAFIKAETDLNVRHFAQPIITTNHLQAINILSNWFKKNALTVEMSLDGYNLIIEREYFKSLYAIYAIANNSFNPSISVTIWQHGGKDFRNDPFNKTVERKLSSRYYGNLTNDRYTRIKWTIIKTALTFWLKRRFTSKQKGVILFATYLDSRNACNNSDAPEFFQLAIEGLVASKKPFFIRSKSADQTAALKTKFPLLSDKILDNSLESLGTSLSKATVAVFPYLGTGFWECSSLGIPSAIINTETTKKHIKGPLSNCIIRPDELSDPDFTSTFFRRDWHSVDYQGKLSIWRIARSLYGDIALLF